MHRNKKQKRPSQAFLLKISYKINRFILIYLPDE